MLRLSESRRRLLLCKIEIQKKSYKPVEINLAQHVEKMRNKEIVKSRVQTFTIDKNSKQKFILRFFSFWIEKKPYNQS